MGEGGGVWGEGVCWGHSGVGREGEKGVWWWGMVSSHLSTARAFSIVGTLTAVALE